MCVRTLRLSCLLTLILLFSSCKAGQDQGPDVTRVDSVGVEVVTLSGPGRTLDWEFVEEWRLGGADEGPSSFSFLHESRVETDAVGNIFVLDSQAGHVAVFDTRGQHLRIIGREGEGPGEFRRPVNLSVDPDGSVSVWDFGKRGLVRFSPDGEYRDLWQPEIRYQGPMLEAWNGSLIFTQMTVTEGQAIETSLVRFDGDSTRVFASMTQPPRAPIPVPGCPVQIPVAPIFSPTMVWDSEDNRTVAVSGGEYELGLFLGDRLVQKIRWDAPLRETTREMAVQELGEGFTIGLSSGPCTSPAEEMVDAQGYAEYLQAIHSVKLSPQNEVWAERGLVRGEQNIIDVFREGRYLGTLPPGFPFPAAFPTEDRLLAVELDEFDVPYLVSYRLERGSF